MRGFAIEDAGIQIHQVSINADHIDGFSTLGVKSEQRALSCEQQQKNSEQ
jgi:hypothetical protein